MAIDAAILATDLTTFRSEYVWEFEVGSLSPYKHEIHLNYVYKLGFCFTEDTPHPNYQVNRSSLFR